MKTLTNEQFETIIEEIQNKIDSNLILNMQKYLELC